MGPHWLPKHFCVKLTNCKNGMQVAETIEKTRRHVLPMDIINVGFRNALECSFWSHPTYSHHTWKMSGAKQVSRILGFWETCGTILKSMFSNIHFWSVSQFDVHLPIDVFKFCSEETIGQSFEILLALLDNVKSCICAPAIENTSFWCWYWHMPKTSMENERQPKQSKLPMLQIQQLTPDSRSMIQTNDFAYPPHSARAWPKWHPTHTTAFEKTVTFFWIINGINQLIDCIDLVMDRPNHSSGHQFTANAIHKQIITFINQLMPLLTKKCNYLTDYCRFSFVFILSSQQHGIIMKLVTMGFKSRTVKKYYDAIPARSRHRAFKPV